MSFLAPSQTVPFNRPSLVGDELAHIRDAIEGGQLAGDGRYTALCSARLREMTGAGAALLTHSCTAALEMAAILCDLGPGDEVVMPSYTFVSTANAVVLRGATPVFVDIDPTTLNICPEAAAAAVTDRTRAIFAVHYAGFPADMDALRAICDRHGLTLVEDAAQALGSTYKGRLAGSLGDMAAFSFHETKNVISGEGGAWTATRPDLVERAEIVREKGTNRGQFFRGEVDKYTWVDVGSSFLPGELVAAYLYGQLERTDEIMARRTGQFDRYMAAFAPAEAAGLVRRPHVPDPAEATGNGHMFYLMMPSLAARTAFIAHMKRAGIGTPFHYVPLHDAPAVRRHARAHGDMSVTRDVSDRLVRLPLHYDLGAEIDWVIETALRWTDRAMAA
jgi:dTDP-4-amino-4,6-dideoxygalactose transaminase